MTTYNKYPFKNTVSATSMRYDVRLGILRANLMQLKAESVCKLR